MTNKNAKQDDVKTQAERTDRSVVFAFEYVTTSTWDAYAKQ